MKYSVHHPDRGMLCKDKQSWTWEYESSSVFKSSNKSELEKIYQADLRVNIVEAKSPWTIAYYKTRGWVRSQEGANNA